MNLWTVPELFVDTSLGGRMFSTVAISSFPLLIPANQIDLKEGFQTGSLSQILLRVS